jgi:hypothetical protein
MLAACHGKLLHKKKVQLERQREEIQKEIE